MDSINSRMQEISKKSKHINLKSTSLINQISQQNKSSTYPNKVQQSTCNNNDINYQQQDTDIPQQATPYNPYTFNKLSLIQSLTTNNKLQSIQQSIQEKKLKYNERFKSKQIDRQIFLNKMSQSLSKVIMITSVQINHNHNSQQVYQDQNYSDDQNVSLTLSGDKPTTQRKFIQRKNSNNKQKDFNIQQKDINSELKMSIHQSKYQQIQLSNPNSKYQSIQKGQKQRKKVILKRSNKQSLQTSQRYEKQQSNYKRIDNNNINKSNKQVDQKQEKKDIIPQNMLRSKNEFIFLQQYQKDQKQIMNRLLNIIQTQINHKKLINQSHYQSPFINQHINQSSKQINKNQSLKASHYRNNQYSSSVKKSKYQPQYSLMVDQDLIKKQKIIRQLQQNRKKKSKNTFNVKNQQQNKHNLSQTVKINLKKNYNLNNLSNKQSQLSSLNQSKQIYIENKEKAGYLKQQTKNLTFREEESQQNSNQQQQEQSDMESINFQQLYQRLKQQQQNNQSKKKNRKQPNSQQVSSPQFSSINPSHQTSINQMLFSQTSVKNSINQSQQKQNNYKFHSQQLKKQTSQPQKNFQNTSFNIQNIPSTQLKQKHSNNISILNTQNKPTVNILQQKKQSVLIQIPFHNQNTFNNNISLADAFKKKFGANKLQNKNKKNQQTQKIHTHQSVQPLSQLKHKNNQSKDFSPIPNLTLQQLQIKNDFDKTLTKQNKYRPIKFNQRNKQNINSLQTPRTQSQKGKQTDRSLKTNSIKQPPKQLIDRLIYGKKVNMSKKDMYQLSKKNYMKLPEIEERRKQQEKKQKQIQRLQKIKQYQKRIRSNKHSLSKDSMKTSIDVDINQ